MSDNFNDEQDKKDKIVYESTEEKAGIFMAASFSVIMIAFTFASIFLSMVSISGIGRCTC